MNTNHYGVIMAGGIGSRFWPVSSDALPKQFLIIDGSGKSLIQNTYSRLLKFLVPENIFIVTNNKYKELVISQLCVKESQIILEPTTKNTAPAIAYTAFKLKKTNPKANIIICPSDHVMKEDEGFEKDANFCLNQAKEKDILITMGISPTSPNIGYGYIKWKGGEDLKPVLEFKEKPTLEKAKEYLNDGNYLWNAGIFIASADTFIEAFKKHKYSIYQLFQESFNELNTKEEEVAIRLLYEKVEEISIDYAILEPFEHIFVLPVFFFWSDLGSWKSLYEYLEKDENQNVIISDKNHIVDCEENMVWSPKKKLVLQGITGKIIVDTEEVLMICDMDEDQKVKEFRNIIHNN